MNPDRFKVFLEKAGKRSFLNKNTLVIKQSKPVELSILKLFHTPRHIDFVKKMSDRGTGLLDYGDTPAFKGVFEIALHSVGATLDASLSVISGEASYAFNPAGGWHHARRDRSGGFCVFNDIGVAIEYLLRKELVEKVYYIDIDAHHGDGVYYPFEDYPQVYIFDVHETGRYLYPGTGFEWETGKGDAEGTKVNIPLNPLSGDDELLRAMDKAYEFGLEIEPDIIILQAGTDGIIGDPITHLQYTVDGHRKAVEIVKSLADKTSQRLVILGGGGYNIHNITEAWINILDVITS
jgi:acetoin utilization protein AcuC